MLTELGRHTKPVRVVVDMAPGCGYGLQTRQMIDDLKREIDELKVRVNGLIFTVVAAIVVDVVMRLSH